MQLIWEVIPGSGGEGQENRNTESGKDSKACVTELVLPLGTRVERSSELCLQSTLVGGIYLQTLIPHYLRGTSRGTNPPQTPQPSWV